MSRLSKGEIDPQDNKTISERSARRTRISALAIKPFPTFRIMDLCEEAGISFVSGCFRSCIFSSATAVEQSLKHSLIFQAEDWEETYWQMEIGRATFEKVIKRAKKGRKIDLKILNRANWLRKARNEIAAHPMYIGNAYDFNTLGPIELKDEDEVIWANKTMLRDFERIVRFLKPSRRREFNETKLSARDPAGNVIEEHTLKDILREKKFDHKNLFLWLGMRNTLLEEVAYDAYESMVEIVNALSVRK
jgi:hypothetical protein